MLKNVFADIKTLDIQQARPAVLAVLELDRESSFDHASCVDVAG